ncbi:hypothetical protein VNI00_017728 [Paramarasmius palmivorus]|uniref:Uncharacterized protein n=1 Tax=Paramarasmius palmivorus TaxID=297713 RepID=A0AAW0B4C4_9AGAR
MDFVHKLRNGKEFAVFWKPAPDIQVQGVTAGGLVSAKQRAASPENLNMGEEVAEEGGENTGRNPILTTIRNLARRLTPPPLKAPWKQSQSQPIPDGKLSFKQAKLLKVRQQYRAARASLRLRAQQQSGTQGLKQCAARHVNSQDAAVSTSYVTPAREWTGPKIPYNSTVYSLPQTLSLPNMRLVRWPDRMQSRMIRDANGGRLAYLAGWAGPGWDSVIQQIQGILRDTFTSIRLPPDSLDHRRGHFPALAMGISFGGGQTQPNNLTHPENTARVLEEARAHSAMQRKARYDDYVMRTQFPELHALYTRVIQKLLQQNPSLRRNFPDCCFAATTFNYDRAHTLRHIDSLNLFCGICAVMAIGDFDYTRGGHLVLWDLGLVIEVPPGCTVYFPSALIEHSNIPIAKHESRSSIVQYSAAGLFRWVHNGGMSDREFRSRAHPKQLKSWKAHRKSRAASTMKAPFFRTLPYTPMPRQRLYQTRAEKKAADRRKWSRYYHKNRDKINASRRKAPSVFPVFPPSHHSPSSKSSVHVNTAINTIEQNAQLPKEVAKGSKKNVSYTGQGARPLLSKQSREFWLQELSNIHEQLEKITGKESDNRQRACSAYQSAITFPTDAGAVAHLDQLHSSLEKLQSNVYDCMTGVLENVGTGELYSEYEDFKGNMVVLLSWIADLTMQAMDGGIPSLTDSYARRTLRFQK